MKKKKKGSGFYRFSRKLLILSCVLFLAGITVIKSYESTLNVEYAKVESEMSDIQSEIDALEIEKQELASFSRVNSIASAKGYTYKQSSVATTIVGEDVE